MDQEDVNPYELLEVTLESTEAEIRKAYRQKSLKCHPDRVCCAYFHHITFRVCVLTIYHLQHPNNPDAGEQQ
jgi:hypothetical protein